jgi:hypothetical protein
MTRAPDLTPVLDREEYIEQAYFFRVLRERLEEHQPTQVILQHLPEEILSTTNLPKAIEYLGIELKHSGHLSFGFAKLAHYFTPFQAFVIEATEIERSRFSIDIGLLILEREAQYRAAGATRQGLFVYQFETLSRNRLGYEKGLERLKLDAFYDDDWRDFIDLTRRQIGAYDLADIIYLRSEMYVRNERRRDPGYEPTAPVLFGEKEGKIARANQGRDPLYFFAALQRQLAYPEVPRARQRDDPATLIGQLRDKLRQLEQRLKLVEGEVRGSVDLSEFMAKPELLHPPEDEE